MDFMTSDSNANFLPQLWSSLQSAVRNLSILMSGFLSLRVKLDFTAEHILIPRPDEGRKAHTGFSEPVSTAELRMAVTIMETVLTNTSKSPPCRTV